MTQFARLFCFTAAHFMNNSESPLYQGLTTVLTAAPVSNLIMFLADITEQHKHNGGLCSELIPMSE